MPTFKLNSDRLLQVELAKEKVMARAGAMVAYTGKIHFEKAIMGGEGLFGALKRKVTGEGMSLMTTSGEGTVYFAHEAEEIAILPLRNEKVFVESSALLVFDVALRTGTVFAGLRGASSGQGLFTTTVEGSGNVAVLSHGGLLRLAVEPGAPLCVDPDAFVGYQGNVQQEFVFDLNWKTLRGQTSGESYQLKFTGSGIVFIQGAERK
jgi:uncharacterized protein (AIM24 family)